MMIFIGQIRIAIENPEELPAAIELTTALLRQAGQTSVTKHLSEIPEKDGDRGTAHDRPDKRQHRPDKKQRQRKHPLESDSGAAASWVAFVDKASKDEGTLRRMLLYILAHPGCTRKDMVRDLNMDHNLISGTINSIRFFGKPLKIQRDDVLEVRHEGAGADVALHYYPGPVLTQRGM